MTQTDKSMTAIFKVLGITPAPEQQAKVRSALKAYYDAKGHQAKTWPVTVICETLEVSMMQNAAKVAQHIL